MSWKDKIRSCRQLKLLGVMAVGTLKDNGKDTACMGGLRSNLAVGSFAKILENLVLIDEFCVVVFDNIHSGGVNKVPRDVICRGCCKKIGCTVESLV